MRKRNTEIHVEKKQGMAEVYKERIKGINTKAKLITLRSNIEANLSVSNDEMSELITEIEKKKQTIIGKKAS